MCKLGLGRIAAKIFIKHVELKRTYAFVDRFELKDMEHIVDELASELVLTTLEMRRLPVRVYFNNVPHWKVVVLCNDDTYKKLVSTLAVKGITFRQIY